MKIFVSIVSYRDPLLHHTIKSLTESASGKYQIVYGIFEQTVLEDSLITLYPELAAREDIRYKRIDPIYSDGVGWARAINALQLNREEFYYEIDSHMLFDEDWDIHLMKDYHLASTIYGTNKIIIAGSCKPYTLDEFTGEPVKLRDDGKTCVLKYFQYCDNHILGAHGDMIPQTEIPMPGIHICAGNFFTQSNWLKDVGINGRIFFDGEEQYMTMSSYAANYKICHPRLLCSYHFNGSGEYVTKQWYNPVDPPNWEKKYSINVSRSVKEWNSLLASLSPGLLENYRKYSGVDYINKKIEKRAITKTIILPEGVEDTWTIEDRLD